MNPQVVDSENIDVGFASRPKRYNTRSAARQALADVSNLTRLPKVGSAPTAKSFNVPVVKKPATDADVSIESEDVFEELEAQVDPDVSKTKHVLVDPTAAEAYASSLKLPLDVVDIDLKDQVIYNHLAESTLAVSIQRSQLSREWESMADPDYILHTNISSHMRSILVDWLVDVQRDLGLSAHSLFLAVNIFDRFLATNDTLVSRSKVQLLGVACLWIASKYEELLSPHLLEFVGITDNTYTSREVLGMEAVICNKLNFVFTVPTALPFAARGLKAFYTMHPNADGRIAAFCHYALELALCEIGMLKYRPSILAASAIGIASHKLGNEQVYWDPTVRFHTGGYTVADLTPCVEDLWALIQRDCDHASQETDAVRRKYSTDEFKKVALIFSSRNSEQLYSNSEDTMDIDNQHRI